MSVRSVKQEQKTRLMMGGFLYSVMPRGIARLRLQFLQVVLTELGDLRRAFRVERTISGFSLAEDSFVKDFLIIRYRLITELLG
jgi:hypothetical protein